MLPLLRQTVLRIKNRMLSRLTRIQKQRVTRAWLDRWDHACEKSWAILTSGTPSPERFHRFERSHTRLLSLIAQKLHK